MYICERCYGPVDPATERYYRLAHIAGADTAGHVTWNHAVVHVDPCGSTAVTSGPGRAGERAPTGAPLLCERCWAPIDRIREPLRSATRSDTTDGDGPLRSFVHALPCLHPDTGDWDPVRRGVSPAALRHAAAQADHR